MSASTYAIGWRRALLTAFAVAWAGSALCLLAVSGAEARAGEGRAKKTQTGLASYYGRAFDGKPTASGEIFDSSALTAAHPTLPLGTRVRVTNLENGTSVVLRITDRGPTEPNQREGVIIDVSREAAKRLRMREDGRVRVRVQVLEWGDDARKDATAAQESRARSARAE